MTEPVEIAAIDIFHWIALMLALTMVTGMVSIAVGNSRQKHHETSANLQAGLFAWMVLFTFLIGWWVRHLFVTGPGFTGGFGDASLAWPWSQAMGASIIPSHSASGLLRHILEVWLVAALVAAALIERIRTNAMFMFAALAGIMSSIGAAWMGSSDGWLVKLTGLHDAFGAAPIHIVAGGFTLGVLQVLGGRAAVMSGSDALEVPASVPWLSALGKLMLIFGMIALAASTLQPMADFTVGNGQMVGTATVFGTPASLFGVTINFLFGAAAGILVGYVKGRGRIDATLSGGLAGVVSLAAGADYFHPLQAFLIAAVVSWAGMSLQRRLRERGFDDAFGTISIHGLSAAIGLVITGFVAWGHPATALDPTVNINPFGNATGAVLAFALLGYLPGYLAARLLNFLQLLRGSLIVEIAGSDLPMEASDARAMKVVAHHEGELVAKTFPSVTLS